MYNENPDCGSGGVRVPAGALDRRYKVDVDCSDVDVAAPEDFIPASRMFSFFPIDLTLALDAEFEFAHKSAAEILIGWRATADEMEWRILDVETEESVFENQDYVAFPYDRFGYFVVLAPGGR